MMNERLVSIIIPVYNSEQYIRKCVDSFLEQTYKNIELILIDDGSDDDSFHILKEYQKRNKDKIFVYTQENQGVATTRNKGISYAKGWYLMFADNDDYVEPDYVETMVTEIEKTQSDMVICSCRKVDASGKTLYEQVLTQDEWAKYRMIAPWARIIRRDFVLDNKIEFGNFKLGEDSYFAITAYNATNKIRTISYIGYNWVQRTTSVSNTTQKKGIASPLPFLTALAERNSKLINIPNSIFEYFVIKFIVWNLYYICDSVDAVTLKKYCANYFKWLEQGYPYYKKNSFVSIGKPKGEEITVRVLVTILTKAPMSIRMIILRILGCVKKYIMLK